MVAVAMILDVLACETGHHNLITVPLVQSPASYKGHYSVLQSAFQ